MPVITFKDECIESLKKIFNYTINANQSYSIIMQLRDLQANHNDIVNISPAFYSWIKYNSIQSLFIEVYKMFDSDKKSDGVCSLFLKIKKNIDKLDNNRPIETRWIKNLHGTRSETKQFSNLSDAISYGLRKIENNSSIFNSIKTQRNKYYAHLDSKIYNPEDLLNSNPVKYSDIKTMLILNMNLYNIINCYFNNNTLLPLASNHDDFKKIINIIIKYKRLKEE